METNDSPCGPDYNQKACFFASGKTEIVIPMPGVNVARGLDKSIKHFTMFKDVRMVTRDEDLRWATSVGEFLYYLGEHIWSCPCMILDLPLCERYNMRQVIRGKVTLKSLINFICKEYGCQFTDEEIEILSQTTSKRKHELEGQKRFLLVGHILKGLSISMESVGPVIVVHMSKSTKSPSMLTSTAYYSIK